MSRYTYDKTNKELGLVAGVPAMDSEPIEDSIKPITSGGVYSELATRDAEISDMNNILGAKNLLPNNGVTQTVCGVTFTVNSDGSVTLKGTATDNYFYRLFLRNFTLPNGRYILSGCPSGGSEETYRLTLTNDNDINVNDYGNDAEFDATGVIFTQCFIKIMSGQTFSNLTFKPMIRPAYITDDTYEPYARSNQELTGEVEPMLNVLGAKNLLPNHAVTQTIAGVTFTVNSYGTVTLNGTATDNYFYGLFKHNLTLPNGRYILSGCPNGGSEQTYKLSLTDNVNMVNEYGNGAEFYTYNITYTQCYIKIISGKTYDNLTFKPMIRPASIKDDTYVPYAMTNRELTVVESETLSNSYFYQPAKIKKCGHVVSLHFFGFQNLVDKSNNNLGEIIPVGYRPDSKICMITLGTTTSIQPYKIAIYANGTINIYPYNGITAQNNLEETFTYII